MSPKMGGVRGGVRRGAPGALRGPGSGVSKKCPESVPGVSGTPFLTLRGHSRDTFWTLRSPAEGPRGHPVGHSLDTPHFRGHSWGHSGDTSGPKRPRDYCSRPAGSQPSHLVQSTFLKHFRGEKGCPWYGPSAHPGRHSATRTLRWAKGTVPGWHLVRYFCQTQTGNGLRVKTERVKTSENHSEEAIFREDFEDIQKYSKIQCKSDIFYLLRNLLKYLLRTFFSSAKFSEVFTPLRFTL